MEQEFEVDSYGCPEHSLLVVVRVRGNRPRNSCVGNQKDLSFYSYC